MKPSIRRLHVIASYLMLFISAFILGCSFSQASPVNKVKSLINQGEKAFQESQVDKAISKYRAARKLLKRSDKPWKLLSIDYKLLDVMLASPVHSDYKSLINEIDSLTGTLHDKHRQLTTLIYKAEVNIENSNFKQALRQLNKAKNSFYKLEKNYFNSLIRIYKDLIYINKSLYQFKKADKNFQKAQSLVKKGEIEGNVRSKLLFSYGNAQHLRTNFDTSIYYLKEGLKLVKNEFSNDHILTVPFYKTLGRAYKNYSRLDSAMHYCNLGLNTLKSHDMLNTTIGGVLFMIRGNVYKRHHKYNLAQRHYQRAKSIYYETLSSTHPKMIFVYLNLASIHKPLNNYDKALSCSNKVLRLIQQQPNPAKYVNLKATCYNVQSKIYLDTDRLQKANKHIRKANHLYRKIYPSDHFNLAGSNIRLSKIAMQQGKYDTALKALRKAKKILIKARGPQHPYLALHGHTQIAKVLQKKGAYKRALAECQKAFEINSTGFHSNGYLSNPDLRQIIDKKAAYYNGIEKVNSLYKLYNQKENKPEIIIHHAYETALLTDSIVEEIKRNILLRQEQTSWLKLNNSFYPLSIRVIKNFIKITPENSNKELEQRAFLLANKDKGAMLTSALAEKKIMQAKDLPDSLFHAIRKINTQVNQLKQKLSKTKDSIKRLKIQSRRLDKLTAKKELYKEICKYHPKYCQSLTDNKLTSINKLQKELNSQGKNMVQYVGYDTTWFALTLTPSDIYITELPVNDSLKYYVRNFRRQLTQPSHKVDRNTAYVLYKKLVKPIEPQLTSDQLVIIPDGILGYLPFSSLLYERTKSRDIKELPFVLKRYALTYSPSASLWNYTQKEIPEDEGLLASNEVRFNGFAPSFKPGSRKDGQPLIAQRDTLRNVLSKLPNANKEVIDILKYLSGEVFLGTEATESKFKESAPHSNIIHLATHGLLNDEKPAYNKLIFAKDSNSKEDGKLHTYELYDLNLNADLAVLSACNTGYGKIREGEGVMSLARGFKVAGCSNILMTLWNIEDRSSAELMNLFYKNLDKGMSKTRALQEAKLTYLNNNDATNANPFYWAGFVMMGSNAQTIPANDSASLYWWFLAGVAILIAVLLLTGIKKRGLQS